MVVHFLMSKKGLNGGHNRSLVPDETEWVEAARLVCLVECHSNADSHQTALVQAHDMNFLGYANVGPLLSTSLLAKLRFQS